MITDPYNQDKVHYLMEDVMSLGYCPCVRWSNGFLLIVPFSLISCNPPIYLLYSLQCLSTTQVDTK